MAIQTTKKVIEEQKSQLEQARKQVSSFDPSISQSREQLSKATIQSQVQIKGLELQRSKLKEQSLSEIKKAEQQLTEQAQSFEEYLTTPEGIKEYVREFNLKPVEEKTVPILIGNNQAYARVKVYKTPYGTYEDKSELEKLQRRAELEAEIRYGTPESVAARYSTPKTYLTNLANLEKYKESINQQNKFSEIGVTPIVQNGKITGFEDKTTQTSYSVQNIPESRIPDFERQGLITVERTTTQIKTPTEEFYEKVSAPRVNVLTSKPIDEPKKDEISLPYQQRGTSFYNQRYYAPTTKLNIPEQQSILEKANKLILSSQTKQQVKYEELKSKGSPWAFLYSREKKDAPQLPFGLAQKPEYISGEKFSPFYFHMFIGTQIAKRLPKTDINVPTWLQKTEQFVRPVVAEIPKVYFFSPFMETAATKKTTTTTKTKASEKVVEKVAKKLEKIVKESKSKKEAEKKIIEYARQYKETALKSGKSKADVNANLREMFQFSQNRGLFNLDDITQNSVRYNPKLAETFSIDVDISAFSTNLPPTLERVPEVQLGTNIFFRGFSEQKSQIESPWSEGKIKENVLTSGVVSAVIPSLNIKSAVIPQVKQRLKLLQSQKPTQKQKYKTKTELTTSQISMLRSLLRQQSIQKTRQLQQQRLRLVQPQIQKQTTKLKLKPIPVIPQVSESPLGLALKKLSKKSKGFDIFIRRRGKDIKAGTARTTKEAGMFLTKGLKSSLAASGFVVEKGTGRKVSFKELSLGFEFRPSKKTPARVVQKRRFRLGTFGEVKEIQKARDDFFDFIGGRSKKKKLKKLGWFK